MNVYPANLGRGSRVHIAWLDSCGGDSRWMTGRAAEEWHADVRGSIHYTVGFVWVADDRGITVVQSHVNHGGGPEEELVSCPMFIPRVAMLTLELLPEPGATPTPPPAAPPEPFDPPRRGFEEANQLIRDELAPVEITPRGARFSGFADELAQWIVPNRSELRSHDVNPNPPTPP